MIVFNNSMFGFVHQIFDTLEILVLTILLGSTQITLHDYAAQRSSMEMSHMQELSFRRTILKYLSDIKGLSKQNPLDTSHKAKGILSRYCFPQNSNLLLF